MALADIGHCWGLFDVKSSGENVAPTHTTFTSKQCSFVVVYFMT